MKCPYRKRIIHKPEHTEGYVTYYAEDIEEFADCCESKCYFYRKKRMTDGSIEERCKRAESED